MNAREALHASNSNEQVLGDDLPWYYPRRKYRHRGLLFGHRSKPHDDPKHYCLYFDLSVFDRSGNEPGFYWCYNKLESERYHTKLEAMHAFNTASIEWPRDPDWRNKRISEEYRQFALRRKVECLSF